MKKIAVFLDLSEMDEILIRYVKKLHEQFEFQEISVIHYVNLDMIPTDLNELIPKSGKSLKEILEEEIHLKIQEVFDFSKDTIKIQIFSQGKFDTFVDWVDSQRFDLLFLGKKAIYDGTGSLSSKLTRLSITNTFLVSEESKSKFERILIPLDFSSYTKYVIEVGQKFYQGAKSEIQTLHIMRTGSQYFPYIPNPKDYETGQVQKALQDYAKWKKKYPFLGDLHTIPKKGVHVSRVIYDFAVISNMDLILLGQKGNNDEDDLLMGSVTERLIANDKSIPVLVVKKG
jgi:nucleotide-binding universal stress UspA family protein